MEAVKSGLTFISGTSMLSQITFALIFVFLLIAVLSGLEYLVNSYNNYANQAVTVLKDTYMSKNGNIVIPQNLKGEFPLLMPSKNQRFGIEFSYSCHLYFDKPTDTKSNNLRHVFHKGVRNCFPVMAPGVFLKENDNIMYVYMNTTTKWDNILEIPGVPLDKWFHFVIVQKGQTLTAYINNLVASTKTFATIPRLNFSGLYIFNDVQYPPPSVMDGAAAATDSLFVVKGSAAGNISRLKYFGFSLNASQITDLFKEGHSEYVATVNSSVVPPYTADNYFI
jgi:hypothetical protein